MMRWWSPSHVELTSLRLQPRKEDYYCCDRKSRVTYAQSFALWGLATIEFTRHHYSIIACSRHIYEWCCSSRTSRSWWITQSTQHHRRGWNNIPSFLQRTALIARSLCEGWTPHDLHILVTAPFCCDRKSRAAYAQSFALWQQATIEFTRHDHSVIACSRHIYEWCCSSRTSRSWWVTQSTQHHRRGCNTTLKAKIYSAFPWDRVIWLPLGKVTFACYSRSTNSSLICLTWQQHKFAQVGLLNSNTISEWL